MNKSKKTKKNKYVAGIDNIYSEFPVCPYCGHKQVEIFDMAEYECKIHKCSNCEKTFEITTHLAIVYSTEKTD